MIVGLDLVIGFLTNKKFKIDYLLYCL